MKSLLILRHAKSSWEDATLADHDRPLNKRGKGDGPRMGRLMCREELLPELIISSTARRARMTAEAVIAEFDQDAELQLTRALYLADAEDYLEVLRDQDNDIQCVMVVGHNPGMEELVELLTGERERMPTAALAHVRIPIESWRSLTEEVEGELENVWRPKEQSP